MKPDNCTLPVSLTFPRDGSRFRDKEITYLRPQARQGSKILERERVQGRGGQGRTRLVVELRLRAAHARGGRRGQEGLQPAEGEANLVP